LCFIEAGRGEGPGEAKEGSCRERRTRETGKGTT